MNKNIKEVILSITQTKFGRLLDLGFEEQNPTHIDLEKLAETYKNLRLDRKFYYIRGLENGFNMPHDHKPPYELDFFLQRVQDTVSLLSMCLGLESNEKVGASILEMIFNIHCLKYLIRYNQIGHIVYHMNEQLLMIKRGSYPLSQKTFRYMTYLCYLLLVKHNQIFETNKLQLKFDKPIFEWTHVIRMGDPQGNYNHFVDFFLAPLYHKITSTSMPCK